MYEFFLDYFVNVVMNWFHTHFGLITAKWTSRIYIFYKISDYVFSPLIIEIYDGTCCFFPQLNLNHVFWFCNENIIKKSWKYRSEKGVWVVIFPHSSYSFQSMKYWVKNIHGTFFLKSLIWFYEVRWPKRITSFSNYLPIVFSISVRSLGVNALPFMSIRRC